MADESPPTDLILNESGVLQADYGKYHPRSRRRYIWWVPNPSDKQIIQRDGVLDRSSLRGIGSHIESVEYRLLPSGFLIFDVHFDVPKLKKNVATDDDARNGITITRTSREIASVLIEELELARPYPKRMYKKPLFDFKTKSTEFFWLAVVMFAVTTLFEQYGGLIAEFLSGSNVEIERLRPNLLDTKWYSVSALTVVIFALFNRRIPQNFMSAIGIISLLLVCVWMLIWMASLNVPCGPVENASSLVCRTLEDLKPGFFLSDPLRLPSKDAPLPSNPYGVSDWVVLSVVSSAFGFAIMGLWNTVRGFLQFFGRKFDIDWLIRDNSLRLPEDDAPDPPEFVLLRQDTNTRRLLLDVDVGTDNWFHDVAARNFSQQTLKEFGEQTVSSVKHVHSLAIDDAMTKYERFKLAAQIKTAWAKRFRTYIAFWGAGVTIWLIGADLVSEHSHNPNEHLVGLHTLPWLLVIWMVITLTWLATFVYAQHFYLARQISFLRQMNKYAASLSPLDHVVEKITRPGTHAKNGQTFQQIALQIQTHLSDDLQTEENKRFWSAAAFSFLTALVVALVTFVNLGVGFWPLPSDAGIFGQ